MRVDVESILAIELDVVEDILRRVEEEIEEGLDIVVWKIITKGFSL